MSIAKSGRARRVLAVGTLAAVTGVVLVAFGGVNIASAVPGLAQYGYGKKKVTICHKGKTVTVGKAALAAHLRHGDRAGACTDARKAKGKGKKGKGKHGRSWTHDGSRKHGSSRASGPATQQVGQGPAQQARSSERSDDDGHRGKGAGKREDEDKRKGKG